MRVILSSFISTLSLYIPSLMNIVSGPDVIESTAACTVLKLPVPSVATVIIIIAFLFNKFIFTF